MAPIGGFDPEEVARNKILFDLMTRAHGKHWKFPFEIEMVLASKEHDQPIPKEAVAKIAQELRSAIEFYHGSAVAIDLETMQARPVKGEATAYIFFDGYKLKIGSLGYQG